MKPTAGCGSSPSPPATPITGCSNIIAALLPAPASRPSTRCAAADQVLGGVDESGNGAFYLIVTPVQGGSEVALIVNGGR